MLLPIWPESECELKPEVPLLQATGELTTDQQKLRLACRGTEANFEPKMLQMQDGLKTQDKEKIEDLDGEDGSEDSHIYELQKYISYTTS